MKVKTAGDRVTRKNIEAKLRTVGLSDRFIELWWGLKLPGLGNRKPSELGLEELAEYVDGYSVETAGVSANV